MIVDMAAETGGNVGADRGRQGDRHDNGVTIIGLTNLPATMPGSATQMYAKNIQTLVKHLLKDGAIDLDFADEITARRDHHPRRQGRARGDRQGAGDRAKAGRGGSRAGGRDRLPAGSRSPEKGGA